MRFALISIPAVLVLGFFALGWHLYQVQTTSAPCKDDPCVEKMLP